MHIALFPNMIKKTSGEIAQQIAAFLKKRNAHVYAEDEVADEIDAAYLSSISPDKIDYIISLGGDGTILRVIQRHPELTAPLMAINFGGLGFMADIPIQETYQSLENLLADKIVISERMMMAGKTEDNRTCYAVNDIIFHRAENPSLIEISIFVDDIYLNTYCADGIIVATPSGSTAYSMAAGGPILTPNLKAFVITPICPHTTSNRPIVLLPSHQIRIEYISKLKPIEVTYDGFSSFQMKTGEKFYLSCAQKKFRLVNMLHHDFYSTLRSKLGWSGKLKADEI
ncbi:NAD(+)/NADH kinase [Neochlamydia sp. S13]|uniref:NAD(+)/NADH kinase n=1 Tax=Neochlamydia sp. S13 TaxID=1353976 RepID=UPI0005AAB413|nr:NAD(+)/NADH kinase [Neochlamydia sp. S13]BBI16775.1 Probable inorganic polyphosphate/ATP-NAD kinase [Neochlamydia sp. S13]